MPAGEYLECIIYAKDNYGNDMDFATVDSFNVSLIKDSVVVYTDLAEL